MIVSKLRYSREELDLKQLDVAKDLNVHSSTVSGWETGKDTIPLEQLIKYANLYKFTLDYLFGIDKRNRDFKEIKIDLNIIGKNLRKLRKIKNLTQEDISKILNTSQSAYAHYENGLYLIPTSFLYELLLFYKISTKEIFN